MRLLLDEMLGRLARWLRFLGHDAAYVRGLADGEILALARASGRRLLTRDVQLARRAAADPGSVLLRTRDLRGQLAELEAALGPALRAATPLSRCALCNVPLVPAPASAPSDRGPLHACPSCGRTYWEGTHVDAIRRLLEGA